MVYSIRVDSYVCLAKLNPYEYKAGERDDAGETS